ncbi:MAG: hypothetical protein ABW346_00240, partial [Terrimicrobium sp.]
MSQRGVSWKGRDLDAFNRTLSTTYAGIVDFIEPGQEPEGELIKIFRRITEAEVTVIDPSAHMNRTILQAIRMVRLPELCADVAARVTVLIYPVDEVSDMDDIAHTFETLADSVDWVIVRNPVKIPRLRTGSAIAALRRGPSGNPGAAFRYPQSSALAGNPDRTRTFPRRGPQERGGSIGHGPPHCPRTMACRFVQPLRCHRRSFDSNRQGEGAEACRLATPFA